MKKFNVVISLTFLSGLFIGCGASVKKDQFISDLVSKMTLEEKVGQMTQIDKRMLDNDEDIATYFMGLYLVEADLFPKTTPQKAGSI